MMVFRKIGWKKRQFSKHGGHRPQSLEIQGTTWNSGKVVIAQAKSSFVGLLFFQSSFLWRKNKFWHRFSWSTLQRKSHLCIPWPFLGIARLQSQFSHSCVCERSIYSQDRSTYLAAVKQIDRSWKYINLSQTYESMNWETEHKILFWK